jgi:hypothetical protein
MIKNTRWLDKWKCNYEGCTLKPWWKCPSCQFIQYCCENHSYLDGHVCIQFPKQVYTICNNELDRLPYLKVTIPQVFAKIPPNHPFVTECAGNRKTKLSE